ncbi:MAG: hypothetical protein M1822_007844 [Bathelium mastoideum]|nr:MAG: hypothetical protein M1822_007844 [Bathelium mastoideum]
MSQEQWMDGMKTIRTITCLRDMRAGLSEWYESLPPEMRLDKIFSNNGNASLSKGLVHMMNLGAIQLLDRVVLSLYFMGQGQTLSEHEIVLAASQSVRSAEHCAQLFDVLMVGGGILKKCWLAM